MIIRYFRFFAVIAAIMLGSCSSEKKDSLSIQSEADLAGLRVALTAGSCYDLDLSAREDIMLNRFNNAPDGLQALLNDKVDVLVDDETVFNAVIRKEHGIKIACKGDKSFPTAFMFGKDHEDLAKACTATQKRMEADGSMLQSKDFWIKDKYIEAESLPFIPGVTEGTPIKVATACSTAPISFMVENQWYGIEVDILRQLAKDLNRPLEIKLYDISSAIMSLESGLVDIVMGGVFVTEERQQQFLFAEPYHAFRSAYYVVDHEAGKQHAGLWAELKNSFRKNLIVEKRWKYITGGLWETVKISVCAILLGSVLGLGLFGLMRSRRKWMRSVATAYNWFIAGIPQLVLLLILFYVVLAKSGFSPTMVAIITFALFFASSASDIYATSLDAIPHGQTEAGLALGFTRLQTFFNIVFPQAVRRGIPLFQGQCVSLLKGTSIVGYIAIQDLTRAGDIIRSRTFDALVPLLVVTAIYFILSWIIGLLLKLALPKKHVI